MKNVISITLLLVTLLFLPTKPVFAASSTEQLEGTVLEITESGQELFLEQPIKYQVLRIAVKKGSKKGQDILVKNTAAGLNPESIHFQEYKAGDLVKTVNNADPNGEANYSLDGKVKRNGLLALALLFTVTVIVVGKLWGGLSLLGLLVSFLVIFNIIVPMIINGYDPVFSAVLGSIIIVPTTFYISHGFNAKTHVGVVATFIGLIVTGLLATLFVQVTHLTGFASEEAGFLQVQRQGSIDIKGLLLAGIIIGTLGILDDVTVGQSSTVQQLKKASPKASMMELYRQGMQVGQDHISSMVNTLVLVYSGSALPLLLLFFDSHRTFFDILESELIAEEIVRMLVGSIGLVLAAPLATIMAAYIYTKVKPPSRKVHENFP